MLGTRRFWQGLLAAFLGGAMAGCTSIITTADESLLTKAGLGKVGVAAVVGGLVTSRAYLMQPPKEQG